MLALVRLLIHLGLQSLRAHKAKSLIVGGLMAMGAFVVVLLYSFYILIRSEAGGGGSDEGG